MSSHIYKLIQEGEHQQQDFKYCINDSKKIAKSLVAFANTDGGRLLVGVKDNGRIAGVRTDEEFYMVEAAAKIYSNPSIDFTTQQWTIEGKTVLEIQIQPSASKPHYAQDDNGKWLAYIRVKDENLLAHKIQLNVWKRNKSATGIHFNFSEPEKFLIDYLQKNDSISFAKYMRLTHIAKHKTEEVLTNFVALDILKMETGKEGTQFTLNKNLDDGIFKKFESGAGIIF